MTSLLITHLRSEYFENPLGLGERWPRLSWVLELEERGQKQSAYRVQVDASRAELLAGNAGLWDSGRVASGQSTQVVYQGQALGSRQRAWWRVTVWDRDGQPVTSEPAWFELGLLAREDWQAQWIGSPMRGGPYASSPAPYLRRAFVLPGAALSARLYITALGLFEPYLNGQRVGADRLAPGWSDYAKRVSVHTYDVTGMLRPGENVLGAILGDGWYCGFVGWHERQYYGDRPRLLAQLEVSLAGGERVTVASDGSWSWSSGPILESDLMMGESYDARRELPGWDAPGYDASNWQPVELFPEPAAAASPRGTTAAASPKGTPAATSAKGTLAAISAKRTLASTFPKETGIRLEPNRGPAVRAQEELKPVTAPRKLDETPHPRWVFDLGQNMVGHVRLKLRGAAGETVRIRYSEVLDADGELYLANLREARATDYYTCKGTGEEVYEPRFTFHGFRYVELRGLSGRPGKDCVTGIVVHSELAPAGSFACSDALINQLQHNIQWGQKGNFVDIPTDCPQRNERLGWTGDAQVFIRTAAFNRDVAAFFTRWQQALADSQGARGQFPSFAPALSNASPDGGPAWADAGLICPWTVRLAYGDDRLLAEHYASFQRYIDYLVTTSPGLIRCHPDTLAESGSVVGEDVRGGEKLFGGYGDWLSIKAETPKDLIGTAFLAYCARLMGQIAAALGKPDDAARYAGLFDDVRAAFQRRFVTPAGLVAGLTQTGYVLALHFDLLPEELRPAAVQELVRDIRARKLHLSTGFVGAPYLLHVLARFGQLDTAYALLRQKSWPSWLYPVSQGATTIWERWDGWTEEAGFQDPGMNSFNHYAYGSVGDWLYGVVAGIELDPDQPGYAHIIIRPRPGGGLTWARAEHESMRGKVASGWKVDKEGLTMEVTIPANSTGTVYVPAGEEGEVDGGGEAPVLEGARFVRMEEGAAVYEVGRERIRLGFALRFVSFYHRDMESQRKTY